jgi:hypothetical protein
MILSLLHFEVYCLERIDLEPGIGPLLTACDRWNCQDDIARTWIQQTNFVYI